MMEIDFEKTLLSEELHWLVSFFKMEIPIILR
jgi:hypothetical protein